MSQCRCVPEAGVWCLWGHSVFLLNGGQSGLLLRSHTKWRFSANGPPHGGSPLDLLTDSITDRAPARGPSAPPSPGATRRHASSGGDTDETGLERP